MFWCLLWCFDVYCDNFWWTLISHVKCDVLFSGTGSWEAGSIERVDEDDGFGELDSLVIVVY